MADVQDIYRGIISPSGGIYKPGPEVQFPSQAPNDALAQLLIQDAKGGAGLATGMRGSGELTYRDLETMANRIPGPNPVAKDQSRLPVEPAGYGPDFAPEGPVTAVPKSKYAFTGSDPFDAYKGSYVATARPASLMSRQPQQQGTGGGLFGIPMSPGMNRNLAGRAGIAGIPGLPPRIQAQQAQKAAIAQALVQAPQQPMFLPNGVANPGYRDYTPTYQSEGGGQMPAAAYGANSGSSFTDSLGGTYYSRHL